VDVEGGAVPDLTLKLSFLQLLYTILCSYFEVPSAEVLLTIFLQRINLYSFSSKLWT